MLENLNVLKTSNLVKREDVDFLKDHSEKFVKRFKTRALYRSKTEMEAGVLNEDEHPIPDSKYWQAIGEQNVQITELISLDFECKKSVADNELLEAEIAEMKNQLPKADKFKAMKLDARLKKKKVQLEQNKFNLTQGEKVAQERMREIKEWEDIITTLEPQLKYGMDNFELCHPERYYLRYKRRMERLELIDSAARENIFSHYNSFEKYFSEQPQLPGGLKPPLLSGSQYQLDYSSLEAAEKSDNVITNYFNRKVRMIMIVAPHRKQGDRNATNFKALQTPAAYSCNIEQPYGFTTPDAQNFVIEKAIKEEVDYIFFVEDDTLIPRMALVQLLHHNADIAGGFYYRKYFPLESAGMHLDEEGKPAAIKNFKIGDIIHNTLVLPMGCALLKVNTLKKIEPPWFKAVSVNDRPALTSDTYICQKMRDIGVDIITDLGIQCIHVDYAKGIFYGHPDIVKNNTIIEEYREYFAA